MAETLIDLIPAEEKVQRSKEKAKKLVMIFSITLFVSSVLASGGLIYYINKLNIQIKTLEDSIETKKVKIRDKADIEINARKLDSKYTHLSQVFDQRLYYSKLLAELSKRVPESVNVSALDSSTPENLNLSGNSQDYVSLAKFLGSLSNPKEATTSIVSEEEQKNNIFKQVSINTITLDPNDARAKFNLVIEINKELLK